MKLIKTILAVTALPLVLTACGDSAEAIAERNAKISEAVAFAADRPEAAGVAVFDKNLVVNIPERDDNFGNLVREVALAASNAEPAAMFTIYVVDGSEVATELPGDGEYVCTVSASDNRIQGNNC